MTLDNYFRELEPYSELEIMNILGNDKETYNKLRIHKIINKNKEGYNFHFVGAIVVDNHVFHIYPKYIQDKKNIEEDFKQVLKVINKYNKVHEDFDSQDEDLEDISIYILSLMIFFIEDYYENGVYHNIKNILETNGNGEINWDRTVNDTFPIIQKNIPYYTELQTNHKMDNLFNYFRLLHEYIITSCSKFLEESGLLEIFDLTPVELSDRTLDDFGDLDYILNRLKMELNVEFNTHKQKLLMAMNNYLSQMDSFSDDKVLTVYGTTDYEYIWEEMCSQVFDNKLDAKLSDLDLGFNNDNTLGSLIKKPKWVFDEVTIKKDTLIPDLITLDTENKLFIIFDAKYYDLNVDIEKKSLDGQPRLRSITKQYLYELAYKEFINSIRFSVKNAFLFPKYDGDIENIGHVELKIFSDLGLEDIQVIRLPAGKVNQMYLENKKMSISKLFLNSQLVN